MTTERQNTIEMGKEAAFIEAVVLPYIEDIIAQNIQQMVGHYRGNQASFAFLLGKTAEISALRTLQSSLESKQVRGDIAAEKEYASGPPKA